jgi:hypothetical protein
VHEEGGWQLSQSSEEAVLKTLVAWCLEDKENLAGWRQ